MLRQSINLYTPFKIVPPNLKYFSWRHLIIIILSFILLLTISLLLKITGFYFYKFDLSSLKNQELELKSLIHTKKAAYPAFFFTDDLSQTVNNLQKNIEIEKSLFDKIYNHISFSDILIALGRIDVSHGWLDKIEIIETGEIIKLTGNALSMDDLKIYFSNIQNDPFFKNSHLTVNTIEASPKPNYPNFQKFTISLSKSTHDNTYS